MKSLMIWFSLVFFLAGSVVHCRAADWNFYGSARVGTFYKDVESSTGTRAKNWNQSLHGTARIGARVKASDTLSGRFEYGASGGNANIRHLFGEWAFGPGKLLVGQTDTPLNFSLSKSALNDHVMNKYGHVDGKRKPMVRLTMGKFMIAAVQPETSDLTIASPVTESKIPKVEAKYRFDMSRGFVDLAAGYQTYELTDTTSSVEYDVSSFILAIGGQLKAGAAYFNADAWLGQNVGPYDYSFSPDGDPGISGTNLVDNESWGTLWALGYTLNDMFSFEAGIGYVQSERNQAGAMKDKAKSYYVQSTITLAPGVMIVPEIGRIDEMTDRNGAPEDDTIYAGAKWQINF